MSTHFVIGSDPSGADSHRTLVAALRAAGIDVEDLGCEQPPEGQQVTCNVLTHYATLVASRVNKGAGAVAGILICGNGVGVAVAANKMDGIRAALCHDEYTARVTRQHNNANVLCFGSKWMAPPLMQACVEAYAAASFEGGRHADRVAKVQLRQMEGSVPWKLGAEKVVVIGSDHAAFGEKIALVQVIEKEGFKVIDVGCHLPERCDYPDFAVPVCAKVIQSGALGILVCGSGIGMSMAACKCSGIRAALCHDEYTARTSRVINDANVLCLGGRVLGNAVLESCVRTFLSTPTEERYQFHRDALAAIDKGPSA